jgi:hypothetical protein
MNEVVDSLVIAWLKQENLKHPWSECDRQYNADAHSFPLILRRSFLFQLLHLLDKLSLEFIVVWNRQGEP